MRWMRSVGSGLILALASVAQQGEIVHMKSDSRLVEVRVVVAQRNGLPVNTLSQKDFLLTDNGRARVIQMFAAAEEDGTSTGKNVPVLPPSVFSNRFEERTTRPVTAILVDERPGSPQATALSMAAQIVNHMEPGERIGVWVSTPVVRLIQDFTTDSVSLETRLAEVRPPSPPPGDAAPKSFPPYPAVSLLTTLGQIATRLSAIPGRKNVLWITEGFAAEISQTGVRAALESMTAAFNEADVALYVLDPRMTPCAGVLRPQPTMAPGISAASPPGALPVAGVTSQQATCFQTRDKKDDRMNEIAERTGGIGMQFHDVTYSTVNHSMGSGGVHGQVQLSTGDNPVADARVSIDDSQYSYTLGFYLNDEEMDGKPHRIDVAVVGRPKLVLRYRKQYVASVGSVKSDSSTLQESTPDSMIDTDIIGMDVKVEPICGNGCHELNLTISLEAATIKRSDANGGDLEEIFTETDKNGRQLVKVDESFKAIWQTYRRMVTYQQVLKFDKDAILLHIQLRDRSSGHLGTLQIPIRDIPGLG